MITATAGLPDGRFGRKVAGVRNPLRAAAAQLLQSLAESFSDSFEANRRHLSHHVSISVHRVQLPVLVHLHVSWRSAQLGRILNRHRITRCRWLWSGRLGGFSHKPTLPQSPSDSTFLAKTILSCLSSVDFSLFALFVFHFILQNQPKYYWNRLIICPTNTVPTMRFQTRRFQSHFYTRLSS